MLKVFMNKIVIFDGSYMMHRACRAMSHFKTSTGKASGGVYGFINILQSQLKHLPSDYFPVVCWDDGLSSRRLSMYPDYKGAQSKRQAVPDTDTQSYLDLFYPQRAKIIEFLEYLGIPSLKYKGWEGDDLIYILTQCSNHSIVSSDDKDMIQLVSPSTSVSRPMAKEFIQYNKDDPNFSEKYIIAKAIIGDPSDNIPKVAAGIGKVTANKIAEWLVENYRGGTYKDTLYECEYPNKKVNDKLLKNYDQFDTNLCLMDLKLAEMDMPSGFQSMIEGSIHMSNHPADYFKLMQILSEYEIKSVDLNALILTVKSRKGGLFI